MTESEESDKFKDLVHLLTERFSECLVIVKNGHGDLFWKSTDKTWAIGACKRYLNSTEEVDREYERKMERNNEE